MAEKEKNLAQKSEQKNLRLERERAPPFGPMRENLPGRVKFTHDGTSCHGRGSQFFYKSFTFAEQPRGPTYATWLHKLHRYMVTWVDFVGRVLKRTFSE
jgi:hypothetical protein